MMNYCTQITQMGDGLQSTDYTDFCPWITRMAAHIETRRATSPCSKHSPAIIQPANIQTLYATSQRCKHTTSNTRLFIAEMLNTTSIHGRCTNNVAIIVETHGVRLCNNNKRRNAAKPKQNRQKLFN